MLISKSMDLVQLGIRMGSGSGIDFSPTEREARLMRTMLVLGKNLTAEHEDEEKHWEDTRDVPCEFWYWMLDEVVSACKETEGEL